MRFGIVIIAIILFGCTKPKQTIQPVLTGKWVEMNVKTDTITFVTDGMIIMSRPKVVSNGFLVPQGGDGPYSYKLLPGKITLQWTLSSMISNNSYSFIQSADKIVIENFYDVNAKGIIQTFLRLK